MKNDYRTYGLSLLLSAFVATFLTTMSFASQTVAAADSHADINTTRKGLAIKGYDPVAYFIQGEAVRGDKDLKHSYGGAVYQFSSNENLERFKANPSQYLPQYNGYCAYGVTKNRKFDIDPKAFEIVDGKLYLNLNKKVQRIWNKDQAALIQEADSNWLSIKSVSDKELAKDW